MNFTWGKKRFTKTWHHSRQLELFPLYFSRFLNPLWQIEQKNEITCKLFIFLSIWHFRKIAKKCLIWILDIWIFELEISKILILILQREKTPKKPKNTSHLILNFVKWDFCIDFQTLWIKSLIFTLVRWGSGPRNKWCIVFWILGWMNSSVNRT